MLPRPKRSSCCASVPSARVTRCAAGRSVSSKRRPTPRPPRRCAIGAGRRPEGMETVVLGRMVTYIALPLRSTAPLTPAWREAITTYPLRRGRIHEDFVITIPHAGVWVTAQAHEPMQQVDVEHREQAG